MRKLTTLKTCSPRIQKSRRFPLGLSRAVPLHTQYFIQISTMRERLLRRKTRRPYSDVTKGGSLQEKTLLRMF